MNPDAVLLDPRNHGPTALELSRSDEGIVRSPVKRVNYCTEKENEGLLVNPLKTVTSELSQDPDPDFKL